MAVKLGYRNVYRDPYGFPQWQEAGLPIDSRPAGLAPQVESPDWPMDKRPLQGWTVLWTLLGVFAGGLALNLTPCVYPMIPITVSFFGGRTNGQPTSQAILVLHGLCYLMGLALINSILGVVAALTGGLMGALLQNPFVLAGVAAILIFFATSLFGFWELRLPAALTQMAGRSYTGYLGSLFMGLTLGVVAAPCIGPFVLGLLTWVAGLGSVWLGFVVFFVLSLGLGLPLFVLAVFSGQLQRLPRAGGWMIWVRKLMGWVLVGMAVYFARPVLPDVFKDLLPVGVAIAAGVHMGWLAKDRSASRAFGWMKAVVGVACLVLAANWATSWALQGPGVDWQPYSETLIEASASRGKPVIIDFYADWCTPCRELEDVTFHHTDVVQLSKNQFTMIKVDVTAGGNRLNERLLALYNVKGVPTVVFLDAQGKERTDLRLVDFMPPERFLGRMAQIEKDGTQ